MTNVRSSDRNERVGQLFHELGTAIEHAWRDEHFDEAGFAAIAVRSFQSFNIPSQCALTDVLQWAAFTEHLPQQVNPESTFGDPPITVYRGRRFFIDMYCWITATNAIHRHAFSGAFQLLEGSSLHTTYRFTPEHRINAGLVLGELERQRAELLRQGDIRPIHAGDALIHAAFHLDAPSATIVARTIVEPQHKPEYSYSPSGVAFDSQILAEDKPLRRRLEALSVFARSGDVDRCCSCFETLLGQLDLASAFAAMQFAEALLQDQPFALARIERALSQAFGNESAPLIGALKEDRRLHTLKMKRTSVLDSELRFFLALLIHIADRATLFRLVREFTASDPAAAVAKWLSALHAQGALDLDLDGPLGPIVNGLLRGDSEEDILVSLETTYHSDEIAAAKPAIRNAVRTLKRDPHLGVLFQAA